MPAQGRGAVLHVFAGNEIERDGASSLPAQPGGLGHSNGHVGKILIKNRSQHQVSLDDLAGDLLALLRREESRPLDIKGLTGPPVMEIDPIPAGLLQPSYQPLINVGKGHLRARLPDQQAHMPTAGRPRAEYNCLGFRRVAHIQIRV